MPATEKPLIAIACGGTGGHLFPGLAVADVFVRLGSAVMLMISPKEIDQQAVKTAVGMRVVTLPAVGFSLRRWREFMGGSWKSYRTARAVFREKRPSGVLAMGGFTSAPPVVAGKAVGAATFLHEGNTIPGKANRWLAHVTDLAFVHFPSTVARLSTQQAITVGMPVREQFQPADPASCRQALGLDPKRPVLLVMGGSQGASGVNELAGAALPEWQRLVPELQYLHLAGPQDVAKVQAAYAAAGARAMVMPFLTEMEMALGAATVAISRAGASSIAEMAAMRVPPILIPYPHATDNHQYYNARALVDAGAAYVLSQAEATPEQLASLVVRLVREEAVRTAMARQLERWHAPRAAETIAEQMIRVMTARGLWPAQERKNNPGSSTGRTVPMVVV